MPKRRRGRSSDSARRDAAVIARRQTAEPFDDLLDAPFADRSPWSPPLLDIEDRRLFYPGNPYTGFQRARNLSGSPARLVVWGSSARSPEMQPRGRQGPSRASVWGPPHRVGFEVPDSVVVCVRRKQRREVIHAKGRAGTRVRKPRRNQYSEIACRRRR